MKKLFLALALLSAALVSCNKVESAGNGKVEGGFTINFSIAGATKAVTEMDGVNGLNENYIYSVNIYIFDGNDDNSKLLFFRTKTIANINSPVNLGLTDEEFAKIFPGTDARTVSVYAVANAPASLSATSSTTIKTLADLKAAAAEISSFGIQESFVMTGYDPNVVEGDVVNEMRSASADITLKRTLAKISLKVNVATSFIKTGDTVTWTPIKDNVKVSLYNIAQGGDVMGNPASANTLGKVEDKTYTAGEAVDGYYPCLYSEPYYTCPRSWSLGADDQPYILITIPWTDGNETKTTYYKVLFSNKSFQSNMWYALNITLRGLGSLVKGDAVMIEDADLIVADWRQSKNGDADFRISASFLEARILDIPQESITLYNAAECSIPYVSTHDCVISSIKLTQYDYSSGTATKLENSFTPPTNPSTSTSGSVEPKSTAKTPKNPATVTLRVDSNNNKFIDFSHILVNSMNVDTFDFGDYIYDIEICHKDVPSVKDHIMIIQHPALSITSEADSNGGTVYVNGNHGSTTDWTTANYPDSGKSMYIISVSQFDDNRIIGDPRERTPWEPTFEPVTDRNSKQLQTYYRTDPSLFNIIAPKYRISSGYGSLYGTRGWYAYGTGNPLGEADAVKRCAAYQEEGYPAGRWRLPTTEELRFIGTLCAKGWIESLFTNNQTYWSAQGSFSYNESNGTFEPVDDDDDDGTHYARCVYDEWYWENIEPVKVDPSQFTWGDMER